MLKHPMLKPIYSAYSIAGEGAILLSSAPKESAIVLHGELYARLIPLLDGSFSLDDLVSQLDTHHNLVEILVAIEQMTLAGYLIENNNRTRPSIEWSWAQSNCNIASSECDLQKTKLGLVVVGKANPQALIYALKDYSLCSDESLDNIDLAIVLTDELLRHDLIKHNQRLLDKGIPWLLVNIHSFMPSIGPLFLPNQPGCYTCLRYHVIRNRPIENFAMQRLKRAEPYVPQMIGIPQREQILCQMAALEIIKFLGKSTSRPLQNQLMTFDVATLTSTAHKLLPYPYCQQCGKAPPAVPVPIVWDPHLAGHRLDGGYRVCTPEATLQRYAHLQSPIIGIVSTLEDNSNGDAHVFHSSHNHALNWSHVKDLKKNFRVFCSGKGFDTSSAKAGALCEALERYSSIYQGNELKRLATYDSLGDEAIHPNQCMLYSEQQYQNREYINRLDEKFNRVPEPLASKASLQWSPVWSLTQERFRYLPTQYLYFKFPKQKELDYTFACSNGNACGNTFEEAVLQGFFELVERDAVAVWWYNQIARPAVDIASFSDPVFDKLLSYYHQLGRKLWILDLSHDLEIPTFAAISSLVGEKSDQLIMGFGCHLDAHLAIGRAMTEMNQLLIPMLKSFEYDDVATKRWLTTAKLEQHHYLLPAQNQKNKVASDYPSWEKSNFIENLTTCQQRVENKGLEFLVLNLTRPEVGLAAAKVIVPGLRHFWARFAPGRLYEVPVALGWLSEPVLEDKLNQTPMFF